MRLATAAYVTLGVVLAAACASDEGDKKADDVPSGMMDGGVDPTGGSAGSGGSGASGGSAGSAGSSSGARGGMAGSAGSTAGGGGTPTGGTAGTGAGGTGGSSGSSGAAGAAGAGGTGAMAGAGGSAGATGGAAGSGGAGGTGTTGGTGGAGGMVGGCSSAVTSASTEAFGDDFGTVQSDNLRAVVADSSNNIIAVGETNGVFPNQTDLLFGDAFVRKLDPNGVESWLMQFSSNNTTTAYRVDVDASDNVIVAGITAAAFPTFTHGGAFDGYIRKLDSSGAEVWTEQFGTGVDDYVIGMGVRRSNGSIVVCGRTLGDLEGMNAGGADAYVRLYDSGGTLQWTQQFGTTEFDQAYGCRFDSQGNIIVGGVTSGDLFSPITGSQDGWARKLEPTMGNEIWSEQFGDSSGGSFVSDLAVDPNDNVVLIGGGLGCGAFARKLDTNGALVWNRGIDMSQALGVATDSAGNVLVTGNGLLVSSTGESEVYVRKLNSGGSEIWTQEYLPAQPKGFGNGVAADGNDNVLLVGKGGLINDADSGVVNQTDAFIAKFGP